MKKQKVGDLLIQYHKWQNDDYRELCKSINEHMNIKEIQSYMPIMALYFYYHNTPKSHKIIDFKRRYYINNIININTSKNSYYNSNKLLEGSVYDSVDNVKYNKEMFLKILPILDPRLHHDYGNGKA